MFSKINKTQALAMLLLMMTIATPIIMTMTTNHADSYTTATPLNKPQITTNQAPPPAVQLKWNHTNTIYGYLDSPAIADINRDGKLEVVISNGTYMEALNTTGVAVNTHYVSPAGSTLCESPLIADLNGTGKLSVLMEANGYLYCLNGTLGETYRVTGYSLLGTPAVGDLDGDGNGKLDIVIGSSNGYIFSFNGSTGAKEWQYPAEAQAVFAAPTLADINKDGKLEVLAEIANSSGDFLLCLNGTANSSGYVSSLWSYIISSWGEGASPGFSSPAVADIDNDGHMEILVGSYNNYYLYCLNCTGGQKWAFLTGSPIESSPTIADIDGDGMKEILIGSDDNVEYCVNSSSGDQKWSFTTGGPVYGSAAVADIDGDKKLEVLVGSDDNLYCLNGTGGSKWNCTVFAAFSSPTVADIDGDNKLEVVLGTDNIFICCLSVTSAPIVPGAYPWPSIGYREDIRHSGCVTDSDHDGLTDNYEVTVGTNPHSPDTDRDTATDYQEFLMSTNPFADTVAPATISNLAASNPTNAIVTLTWTAPGNNSMSGNATDYVVKYSTTGLISETNWSTATTYPQTWKPAKNGTTETRLVTGLAQETTYWFAIKARDAASNFGFISNSPHIKTVDSIPPAMITDLAAIGPTNTTITLTWTTPGDDGNNANATGYWVKYSTSGPVTSANWASATNFTQSWVPVKNGTAETHVVTGLSPHIQYWFAIEAFDEAHNYGGVSNSPRITTLTTGWQSNPPINMIQAGNNATTPAGTFQNYGFSMVTTNATNVVVTSASSRPTGVGAPPSGEQSFLYLDIKGTQISGTTGVAIYVYYNRTLVQQLGLDELSLQIHRWNSTTSEWDAVPSTVTILNTTFGVITAHLNHFSYFAVLGSSSSGGSPVSVLVVGVALVAIVIVALAAIVLKKRKSVEPITKKSKAKRAS